MAKLQATSGPDVIAVTRPQIPDLLQRYFPQESLSPRQNLQARQAQMPDHPAVAPLEGDFYKLLQRLWKMYAAKQARFRWLR